MYSENTNEIEELSLKSNDSEPFLDFLKEQKFNLNDNDSSTDLEKIYKCLDYVEKKITSDFKKENDLNNLDTSKTSNNNQMLIDQKTDYCFSDNKRECTEIIYEKNEKDISSSEDEDLKMLKINNLKIKKSRKKRIRNKMNQISEEKKKFMGRKTNRSKKNEEKKNSPEKKGHSNLSNDNVIYKIKVKFQKFYYSFIGKLTKKYKIQGSFKRVNGDYTRNGNVKHNLRLFQLSMRDFLQNEVSGKYSNKDNLNDNLIAQIDEKEELKKYIDISYIDCMEKYFRMKTKEFELEFGYVNENLFEEIKIKPEERSIWENLMNFGLINYFKGKTPRSTITEEAKQEAKNQKKTKL
jgi:hypothetical protein